VILVLDNYDSFTWNLVHAVAMCRPGLRLARDLVVARHDEITTREIRGLDSGRPPEGILISPGPCTPREAGVSCAVVREFAGVIPILGVCLGHQCIAAAFDMRIVHAPEPVHGKTSPVHHDGRGVFKGLGTPVDAMRYHSLAVEEASIPREGWRVSAWAGEGSARVVMGLRREPSRAGQAVLEGVQFHPESFMTPTGLRMIANFLNAGR
jgi:anthranilate synthase/aminodeoxychorismate synthase-like glutamine amidotransferase